MAYRSTRMRCVALLVLASAGAQAANDGGRWPDSYHLDQDLFAIGSNEDRNYTMGLRFTWYGDKASSSGLRVLRAIDGRLGFEYEPQTTYPATSLGNSAFTPDELRATEPIREDRPYASLLYVATSVVVPDPDPQRARGSKLVVGLLGLPISEWVQAGIHRALRSGGSETPYDPKGWHNQISDGGEPTFLYQRSWMRRLAGPRDGGTPVFDAAGSCDASIGYYTGASCGVVARLWGRTSETSGWTPFWSMLDEVNPQGDANHLNLQGAAHVDLKYREMLATTAVVPSTGAEDRWLREWYVMGGVRGRLVGYNELLQGGFRDSALTFGGSDIERLVWETSLGLNFTFRNRDRLLLTCTQRSPEHERAESRAHRWCGLNYYVDRSKR